MHKKDKTSTNFSNFAKLVTVCEGSIPDLIVVEWLN